MLSPLEVEILLHYQTCASDFRDLDAPAIKSAIQDFVQMGLLYKSTFGHKKYIANDEALSKYVEAICSVPLPKRKWVI